MERRVNKMNFGLLLDLVRNVEKHQQEYCDRLGCTLEELNELCKDLRKKIMDGY
jgi:hypothetical protein